MKQSVGILLDDDTYKRIPSRKTGYEKIALYNIAARKLDLQPFYMSLRHMKQNSAIGFSFDGNRYKLTRLKIPKVTHNRAITLSPIGKKN
jgi:hypothetical protein